MRAWALFAATLVLAGCQQLNPDLGRFSCDAGADCGEGFECRPRFSGGALCFKVGECTDLEVCDGVDQNCDGRVDESFPEAGEACTTGKPGVCAAGTRICAVGALGCQQTLQPSAELCNGLDDDCNGQVDEGFDFTNDALHCGGCGQRCDAGTSCLGSVCRETSCDDGADNDQDGLTDCDDDSCRGQTCGLPMVPAWRCGALPSPPPVVDAGADGGADGGDAGADAGLDGGPDAGMDGGADGGVDGGADGGVDGGADAGADGGSDAGLDAGGGDAGFWDGGPLLGCYPPEADCANGFDDDGDGEADCLDLDCAGQTCASGTTCTNRSCPGPG